MAIFSAFSKLHPGTSIDVADIINLTVSKTVLSTECLQ
jgi:hypothetical protein